MSDYLWFMVIKGALLVIGAAVYGYYHGRSKERRRQEQEQISRSIAAPADR